MENISDNELVLRKLALEENLKDIRERIALASHSAGVNEKDITLLAATKTVPYEVINHAIALGVDHIGENRVQELCSKYDYLDKSACEVHMIGHLQTNKVKQVADKVSMIQSVDSLRLAQEINRVCAAQGKKMQVLVEVNIGKEENKSGVLPEAAEEFVSQIAAFNAIEVCGLMAIPPICENESDIRQYFAKMRKLFLDIRDKKLDNIIMKHLSMGMSDDFEAAIKEGSTMVRVGSALFGKRVYNK